MSAITLASGGKARHVIVLGPSATPTDQLAARELAWHLKAVTQATFRIKRLDRNPVSPVIAVGPEAAARVLEKRPVRLGDEGVLIQTVAPHLVLTGEQGSPRGTLYAVYVFLEEKLGIRWYTPDVTHIPQQRDLRIEAFRCRARPAFRYREVLQWEAWDEAWAARNRTNGQWERNDGTNGLPAEWGGHWLYAWWVHSFYTMLPPENYFADHPEWYSQIDGTRQPDTQLCLTNRVMLNEAIEHVLKRLREVPDAKAISISQNDNYGNCQCPDCRASDAKYRPSGTLLRFINAIAKKVETEFPDVLVDTLAYQYTRRPPRKVCPRANVAIRICAFENDLLHPLTHPNNACFREDLEGWARLTRNLTIWDYLTNYAHSVMPFPNWFTMGTNIRYLASIGLSGCFLQSNQYSPGGEMGLLRMWVLARLMWNPRLSPEKLIREFLDGVYGPAGPHLLATMRVIHTAALHVDHFPGSTAILNSIRRSGAKVSPRTGCVLDLNSPVDAPFLTPGLLLQAVEHIHAAREAVREMLPPLRQRVELARLPVLYAILLQWDTVFAYATSVGNAWPLPASRMALCREFIKICRKNGITKLGEAWTRRTPEWLARVCAGEEPWTEFP